MDHHTKKTFAELSTRNDWFRKSYQAREFPWHVQIWSIQKMMQCFPWSQKYGGTISEASGMQHWLWNIAEMGRVRVDFLDRVLRDAEFLNHFERDFFTQWDTFIQADQKYAAAYPTMHASARIEAFFQLCDVESNIGMYGYMNDIFLTTGGSDWLLEWFERELLQDMADREQVIADLATPVQASFVQEQQMGLIQIALRPESEWSALLQAHAEQWSWVENSYIESVPLTAAQFEENMRALLKNGEATPERLKQLQDAPTTKFARKSALYEQYGISQTLQRLIDCSDRISHMTDMRKQGVLRLNARIWQFFNDLSAAVAVPFDTLIWMMPGEMLETISAKKWQILEERMHSGAMTLLHEGRLSVVQGDEFGKLDLSPFLGAGSDATHLKGQVAFAGVVTGRARIIRGRNDFHLFSDGDILITNQTTPEFIPLMKRAAAVVTEQGGITCHAAIVSREMQIPCIIGCTSAMTFFHDNQQITVDGTKGEVRYG
jgi:phosphohistidine swiveling domain-containing protein